MRHVVLTGLAAGLTTSGGVCLRSDHSAVRAQCRHLSPQANQWVNELRYGAEDGPVFGSFGSTFSDSALATRQLYCQALVFASGSGRRSRDWIAGCSAMTSPNQALLSIALQYTATEADVVALREHLIGKLLQADGASDDAADPLTALQDPSLSQPRLPRQGSTPLSGLHRGKRDSATQGGNAAPPSQHALEGDDEEDEEDETAKLIRRLSRQLTSAETEQSLEERSAADYRGGQGKARTDTERVADDETPSPQPTPPPAHTPAELKEAEDCLLRNAPEVRCFVYDAMTASLFHCHGDVAIVEEARRRVFTLGMTYFGLTDEILRPIWRTVEAELIVRKEKLRMLGQSWGE